MNTKAFKQILLTITVIMTVMVSLVRVSPVLAEDTVPPTSEPAAVEETQAEEPAAEETAEAPADPVETEAPAEPVGPASGEAGPTGEPPAGEETDGDEPPAVEEDLAEIIEILDENDIVLVDEQGEPVPLASEEAAEVLQSGNDPWFVDTDGSVKGYTTLSGTCAPVVTVCNKVSNPLQSAINAAPAGSVITIDGTYAEQVTINKDLTLQGATTGGTLRAPGSLTSSGTMGSGLFTTTNLYSLIRITSGNVTIRDLRIENLTLAGGSNDDPITTITNAYFMGIFFDGGTGTVNNNYITGFSDTTDLLNQIGIGIYVRETSSDVTIDNNWIENNEVGVWVEGDRVNVTRNQIESNGTGLRAGIGVGASDPSGLIINNNNFSFNKNYSVNENTSNPINVGVIPQNYWVNSGGDLCTLSSNWNIWLLFKLCANINLGGFDDETSEIGTTLSNAEPLDHDNDGAGILDNCPSKANPSQADFDNDGAGDECDDDDDSDGVDDAPDNCLLLYNPDQADADGDGIGDACDTFTDSDGDGIADGSDNCPLVANADQLDTDRDGQGDKCDNDDDDDGVNDAADNCPLVSNLDQIDTDMDLQGNACDPDDDNDGVDDTPDNCPLVANASQTDTDGDGQGDACDSDDDGDGVDDTPDNCPLVANASQTDTDADGQGDACDTDDDGDGIPDVSDSCPVTRNWGVDADSDGIDDACDPLVDTGSGSSGGGLTGGLGGFIIPVTGSQPQKIDCTRPITIMQLPNADRALFSGLCGFDASLESISQTTVDGLKALPSGVSLVSGLGVSVLEDDSLVDPLPGSSSLTLSFVIPDAFQGKTLSILFWDEAKGDWVKLPVQVVKDGLVVPTNLNGDPTGSNLSILNGVHVSGNRIEVTVNFAGTFILTAE